MLMYVYIYWMIKNGVGREFAIYAESRSEADRKLAKRFEDDVTVSTAYLRRETW